MQSLRTFSSSSCHSQKPDVIKKFTGCFIALSRNYGLYRDTRWVQRLKKIIAFFNVWNRQLAGFWVLCCGIAFNGFRFRQSFAASILACTTREVEATYILNKNCLFSICRLTLKSIAVCRYKKSKEIPASLFFSLWNDGLRRHILSNNSYSI